MTRRPQDESEQAAKVYQLDAVESKVDQAITKLDAILAQTNGLVTVTQLGTSERQLKEQIQEEVEKINLTYGPMKRNVSWFIKAIIIEGIAIIGQGVIIFMIGNK